MTNKIVYMVLLTVFVCFTSAHSGTFKVTKEKYSFRADLNSVIKEKFGKAYRLADWEDIQREYGKDMNPDQIIGSKLNKDSAFCTRNGNKFYNSGRHYFASRNNHKPHKGYMVHKSINNNLFSLGSWHGNYKILAYCSSCGKNENQNKYETWESNERVSSTVTNSCGSGVIELEKRNSFPAGRELPINGGINFFDGDFEVIHPGSVTIFEFFIQVEGEKIKRVIKKRFRSIKDNRYRGYYFPVKFKKRGRYKITLTAFVKTSKSGETGSIKDYNCSVSYWTNVF